MVCFQQGNLDSSTMDKVDVALGAYIDLNLFD